jgi:hypothetical protein
VSVRSALAAGDLVEVVLHRGGEVVVDELAEVLLEQFTTANASTTARAPLPFFQT